jgi:hypothetical protein
MYDRPFPASAIASAVFVGATPQQLLAGNAQRAEAKLQGVDAFFVGVGSAMSASSGLLVASGALYTERYHTGPLFAISAAGAAATIAIRTWESGM